MNLMRVFDSLTDEQQGQAKRMADAARSELREYVAPLNDDRAAIFDEACAVFLRACLVADGVKS
jgi:hypothetical protein